MTIARQLLWTNQYKMTGQCAVTASSSPYVLAYQWSDAQGFGRAYTSPSNVPGGYPMDVTFSPDKSAIVLGLYGSPFVCAYAWSSAGFGALYANPATLPASNNSTYGYQVSFSRSGKSLAVALYGSLSNSDAPIAVYPWSSSGFGARYSSPTSLTALQGYASTGVKFSPDGAAIVAAVWTPPYAFASQWADGTGFGTSYSSPTTLTSYTYDVDFCPDGSAVIIGTESTTSYAAYQWSSSSGFGAMYSNPSSLPGRPYGVKFSPSGNAFLSSHVGAPYFAAYAWSSAGFGTKLSNPTTVPSGNAGSPPEFSPSGLAVGIATSGSPWVSVYQWSDVTGFGAMFSQPQTLFQSTGGAGSTQGTGIAFC